MALARPVYNHWLQSVNPLFYQSSSTRPRPVGGRLNAEIPSRGLALMSGAAYGWIVICQWVWVWLPVATFGNQMATIINQSKQ
jgi:hypothetical protein